MDHLDRKLAVLMLRAYADGRRMNGESLLDFVGETPEERTRLRQRYRPLGLTYDGIANELSNRIERPDRGVFGVCVLVEREDGYVLVTNRRGDPDDLCLPGGHVEPGEPPHDAAARELEEETGMTALNFGCIYRAHDADGHLVYVYKAFNPFGQLRPEPGHTVQWVPPERLVDERNTFSLFYENLFRARSGWR